MKENFNAALDFVLRHECVYEAGHDGDLGFVICENVPGDAGGCTKFGIDAASHPGIEIGDLTLEEATAIYHEEEWTWCSCDELPGGLDTATFDCAVNNGTVVAGLLLQRALIACGSGVVVDGEIGEQTLRNAAFANGSDLLSQLLQLRRQRYVDIVLHRPADAKFLKGWLNRVNDLERYLF